MTIYIVWSSQLGLIYAVCSTLEIAEQRLAVVKANILAYGGTPDHIFIDGYPVDRVIAAD